MKVAVILTTAEIIRCAKFTWDCIRLACHDDYKWILRTAGVGNYCFRQNQSIRDALADSQVSHLFFLDDDMRFPADTIDRLLAHNLSMVSGLNVIRVPPYQRVIFLPHGDTDLEGNHDFYPRNHVPDVGVIKGRGGKTGLLVKREVFEAMTDPWFTVNQWHREHIQEDLFFHHKAEEAGFTSMIDCSLKFGHSHGVTVYPVEDGEAVDLDLGDTCERVRIKYHAGKKP